MSAFVVTTSPGFGRIGKVPSEIEARKWKFVRCIDTNVDGGGVYDYIDDMEFLVVGLIAATGDIITKAPKLKAVLKHGVGVDNIAISAATARKIPVINAPGTNANAVAELATGMMFSLARQIPMVHNEIIGGGWLRYVGTEVTGKTLGIVGLGNIGRSLALKARALGMNVLASDLYPNREFAEQNQIRIVDHLDELLAESDYVSLHVFGGEDNSHLIGERELNLMKDSSFLMNFARGEIVDVDALADALKAEKIKGAAIDAYVTEPPDVSHPIFAMKNVIFTPHSGADTIESVERMGLSNIADIEHVLAGEISPRVLNKEIYE